MTSIVGWGHTPFGKLTEETVETLVVRAAREALDHAGIAAEDVDEIVLGHFNAGFSRQDFTAALVLQAYPIFRHKPATRVENACASGSAAVYAGARAIEAGDARIVLVVGVEKMTDTMGPAIGDNLLRASYLAEQSNVKGGFVGVFGDIASQYFARFGDQSDALAAIAAKNHRNALDNPYAQIRKDLGYDFCRQESLDNPRVAGPLKRTDCSLVSDGAAALVMTDDETARTMRRAVRLRGRAHATDFLPMSARDATELHGAQVAWGKMMERSGLQLSDLSFAELHDCFTIAELMQYEAIGLAAPGEGAHAILEGLTEKTGKLPVNVSGGLKAKGHPIGATGVSMHAIAAMQLCGEAPAGMQLASPSVGAVFNMGGTAVANYATALERIH
ncbi:acetyl-CoA acetyltransferase [Sphingopyxis sp. SE2]|uniref:acetyl-CoA acetyltransferase n=1 Tax=Sphingopyxis sp. SE2 TaxID=1586240 RepID=UPI0028C1724A|nr:acetyl-CoA acetyltransferase [Sphingopyxis sp. SE2]MDT7531693.1 acetyl-CoA acetyltransferase [Sphingopyxis sp. SE2]